MILRTNINCFLLRIRTMVVKLSWSCCCFTLPLLTACSLPVTVHTYNSLVSHLHLINHTFLKDPRYSRNSWLQALSSKNKLSNYFDIDWCIENRPYSAYCFTFSKAQWWDDRHIDTRRLSIGQYDRMWTSIIGIPNNSLLFMATVCYTEKIDLRMPWLTN